MVSLLTATLHEAGRAISGLNGWFKGGDFVNRDLILSPSFRTHFLSSGPTVAGRNVVGEYSRGFGCCVAELPRRDSQSVGWFTWRRGGAGGRPKTTSLADACLGVSYRIETTARERGATGTTEIRALIHEKPAPSGAGLASAARRSPLVSCRPGTRGRWCAHQRETDQCRQ